MLMGSMAHFMTSFATGCDILFRLACRWPLPYYDMPAAPPNYGIRAVINAAADAAIIRP